MSELQESLSMTASTIESTVHRLDVEGGKKEIVNQDVNHEEKEEKSHGIGHSQAHHHDIASNQNQINNSIPNDSNSMPVSESNQTLKTNHSEVDHHHDVTNDNNKDHPPPAATAPLSQLSHRTQLSTIVSDDLYSARLTYTTSTRTHPIESDVETDYYSNSNRSDTSYLIDHHWVDTIDRTGKRCYYNAHTGVISYKHPSRMNEKKGLKSAEKTRVRREENASLSRQSSGYYGDTQYDDSGYESGYHTGQSHRHERRHRNTRTHKPVVAPPMINLKKYVDQMGTSTTHSMKQRKHHSKSMKSSLHHHTNHHKAAHHHPTSSSLSLALPVPLHQIEATHPPRQQQPQELHHAQDSDTLHTLAEKEKSRLRGIYVRSSSAHSTRPQSRTQQARAHTPFNGKRPISASWNTSVSVNDSRSGNHTNQQYHFSVPLPSSSLQRTQVHPHSHPQKPENHPYDGSENDEEQAEDDGDMNVNMNENLVSDDHETFRSNHNDEEVLHEQGDELTNRKDFTGNNEDNENEIDDHRVPSNDTFRSDTSTTTTSDPSHNIPTTLHDSTMKSQMPHRILQQTKQRIQSAASYYTQNKNLSGAHRISSANQLQQQQPWSYPITDEGVYLCDNPQTTMNTEMNTLGRTMPLMSKSSSTTSLSSLIPSHTRISSSNSSKTHTQRANELLRTRLSSMAVVLGDIVKHISTLTQSSSYIQTELTKLQSYIDRTHQALKIVSQRNEYRQIAAKHPIIVNAMTVTEGDAELEQSLFTEYHTYHSLIETLQQQHQQGSHHLTTLQYLLTALQHQQIELQVLIQADQACLDMTQYEGGYLPQRHYTSFNIPPSFSSTHHNHIRLRSPTHSHSAPSKPFDPHVLQQTIQSIHSTRLDATTYIQANNVLLDTISRTLRDLRRKSGFAARTCVQHAAEQKSSLNTLINTNASKLPGLLKYEKELKYKVSQTIKPLKICEQRYAMRLDASSAMPCDEDGNAIDPVRDQLVIELQSLHEELNRLQLEMHSVEGEIKVCQDVSNDFNVSMHAATTILEFYHSILALDPSELSSSAAISNGAPSLGRTASSLLNRSMSKKKKNGDPSTSNSYLSESEKKAELELQRVRNQAMRKEIALLDRMRVQANRAKQPKEKISEVEKAIKALSVTL